MRSFSGGGKCRAYFEGWYFKQQNETQTLALIPAFHIDAAGRPSASLQVVTDAGTWHTEFPAEAFAADSRRLAIRVGDSVFSRRGCALNLRTPELSVRGELRYGPFTPPAGDIMGPFRLVPFLECRHRILSLCHTVSGEIAVNGTAVSFHAGKGYLEGDRGSSFPSRYVWTQCLRGSDSLMLSAARIPFCGGTFTGCIGFVYTGGREWRIATYRGAKLLEVDNRGLTVRQGELTLRAELLSGSPRMLRAPRNGDMVRLIRESPACRVRYTCTVGEHTLLDFASERASFEDNWG